MGVRLAGCIGSRGIGPLMNGIIRRATGHVFMREITLRPDELNPRQQEALRSKMLKLERWTSAPQTFSKCKTLPELFQVAGQHADALFSPRSVTFIRNQITDSTVVGNHGSTIVPPEALSLSEPTSAVAFCHEKNMLVYMPSTSGKQLFLGDDKNGIFESTLSETGIKLGALLQGSVKSFSVVPIFSRDLSDHVLGSVLMGWDKGSPLDPFSNFEPARVLVEYLSYPFFELSLRQEQ